VTQRRWGGAEPSRESGVLGHACYFGLPGSRMRRKVPITLIRQESLVVVADCAPPAIARNQRWCGVDIDGRMQYVIRLRVAPTPMIPLRKGDEGRFRHVITETAPAQSSKPCAEQWVSARADSPRMRTFAFGQTRHTKAGNAIAPRLAHGALI
jgi:hypothetical protein